MTDLVTGAAAGTAASANDIDGGMTASDHQHSPWGAPAAPAGRLDFQYTFAHNAKATSADYLRVSVGGDVVFTQTGFPRSIETRVWTPVSIDLDAYAGQSVRIVIQAADGGRGFARRGSRRRRPCLPTAVIIFGRKVTREHGRSTGVPACIAVGGSGTLLAQPGRRHGRQMRPIFRPATRATTRTPR